MSCTVEGGEFTQFKNKIKFKNKNVFSSELLAEKRLKIYLCNAFDICLSDCPTSETSFSLS